MNPPRPRGRDNADMTVSPDVNPFRVRPMRRVLVALSVGFALLLTAVTFVIVVVVRDGSFQLLFAGDPRVHRLALGAGIGVGAAAIGLLVVARLRSLATFRRLIYEAMDGLEPRVIDFAVVSLAAGWGEELLFRGVIQPWLGVWVTSVLFVALHGKLRPRSWGGVAFMVSIYIGSVGLGYLCDWRGLEAAMSAHATYDFVMLMGLRRIVAGMSAGAVTEGKPVAGRAD